MLFIIAAIVGLAAATPVPAGFTPSHSHKPGCSYTSASIDEAFHLAAYSGDSSSQPVWLTLNRINVISPYSDRFLLRGADSPVNATTFTFDSRSRRLRTLITREKDGAYQWGFHSADLASGELITFAADEGTSLPESAFTTVRESRCGGAHDELYLDDGRALSLGGDLTDSWWLCEHDIPAGQKQLYYSGSSSGMEPDGCVPASLRLTPLR